LLQSFIPLTGRARWAVIALGAVFLTDLLAIFVTGVQLVVVSLVLAEKDVSLQVIDAMRMSIDAASVISWCALVACVFFFLRWFHPAYRNLAVVSDAPLRFSSRWAIAAWFVPPFAFWRPKQLANDLWRRTDPSGVGETAGAKTSPLPRFLQAWWVVWITGFVAGFVIGVLIEVWSSETLEALRREAFITLVLGLVDGCAALLAIVLVRRVTERQELLASRRSSHAHEARGEVSSSALAPGED
jgi:Domain of unknown function (DUF4328)